MDNNRLPVKSADTSFGKIRLVKRSPYPPHVNSDHKAASVSKEKRKKERLDLICFSTQRTPKRKLMCDVQVLFFVLFILQILRNVLGVNARGHFLFCAQTLHCMRLKFIFPGIFLELTCILLLTNVR